MEKPSLLTHLEVLALMENAGRANGPTTLQAKSPQWEDFGISVSGGINYTTPFNVHRNRTLPIYGTPALWGLLESFQLCWLGGDWPVVPVVRLWKQN